jgi:hypothetical protein
MQRAIWYLKRLAVMRPREIAHRLGEQVRIFGMRRRYRRGGNPGQSHDPANFKFSTSPDIRLPMLDWLFDPGETERSALLAGQGAALGYSWIWSDKDDVWRRAPDTGRLWLAGFFADVPYRAGNPHGDVRVVWEPSRLQHLVALALLARDAEGETADAAVTMIEAQLRSWLVANPPWTGVHYLSAMECGLRLIAVCHALDLVRDRLRARAETWQGPTLAAFLCR